METASHKSSLAAAGVVAGQWCVHPLPAHTLQVLGVSAKRARLMSWRTIAEKLGREVPPGLRRARPTSGGFEESYEKRQRVKRAALAAEAAKKKAKRMKREALQEEVRARAVAQFHQRLAGATQGSDIYAFNDTWLIDVCWGTHEGVTYYQCEAARGVEHLAASCVSGLPRLAIHGGDYGIAEELVRTIGSLTEPRFYRNKRVWHDHRVGGCTCCPPRRRPLRAAELQGEIEFAVDFDWAFDSDDDSVPPQQQQGLRVHSLMA